MEDINGFADFITYWLMNQSRMSNFSTLFTFDDVGNEAPVEPLISSFDEEKFYVRSVFSRKNVYFLNTDIWLEIMSQGRKDVPIDCVLSFDTQFGNYALKYIKNPEFKNTELGSSFHKLLEFIYKNKINPEFSFYLQENYSNYLVGKEKEIKNQLFALVKLVDLDKEVFLDSGEIQLNYGANDPTRRVDELLSSYKNKDVLEHYHDMEYLQTSIACLILKAALLKKDGIDDRDKVKELVLFCHNEISSILGLELYILSLWLLGNKIDFFDPVNGGDKLHTLPSKINGMAWDFMLIRHVERYCSVFNRNKYTLAYFSSFDRRMVEMSDLYKNRGCLYPPKNLLKRFFMIPELKLNEWYAEVVSEDFSLEIFNSEMWKYRDDHRPRAEKLASLRRALEYELLKAYSGKKS